MGSPEHHEGFCVSLRPAGCCLSCPKCPTSWLWRWPDLPPVSLQTLWRTEKHCPVQGFWSCPRLCSSRDFLRSSQHTVLTDQSLILEPTMPPLLSIMPLLIMPLLSIMPQPITPLLSTLLQPITPPLSTLLQPITLSQLTLMSLLLTPTPTLLLMTTPSLLSML